MSAIPIFSGLGATTALAVNFNTTTYFNWSTDANATEQNRRVRLQLATTFSLFHITISANTIATSATTIRVRKNSINGNQVLSIGAGVTGRIQDTTNSDAFAAGDDLSFQIVTPNTSGAISLSAIGILNMASANTSTVFSGRNGSAGTANTTFFTALDGGNASAATEAPTQTKMRTAGTLKKLTTTIVTNTRGSSSTTLRVRINGGNGTLAAVIGASVTGIVEDTTNSDAVAVNDLVNYSHVYGGGSGTITYGVIAGVALETTDGTSMLIGSSAGAITQAANVTRYWPAGGEVDPWRTAEADAALLAMSSYTASKLGAYIVANTVTATSTLRTRKNGGNGNQSASIGSGVTGLVEDTTNSDSYTATDLFNYSLVTGATGTAITLGQLYLKVAQPAAAGGWGPLLGLQRNRLVRARQRPRPGQRPAMSLPTPLLRKVA